MTLIELTVCRKGEGRTVASLLPSPVCFAHINALRPECDKVTGTFFASFAHMEREGGLAAVLDHLGLFRNVRGDRLVIEWTGKAMIGGVADPRIGSITDLREDRRYLDFLKQRLKVDLDPEFIRAVTENGGLRDSMRQTLRADIARLIIIESFTGRISRQGNLIRVYDLLEIVAERAPVDIVLDGFSSMTAVYPAELLVRIVAAFFSRVLDFMCGNNSYMKSRHAILIRRAADNFKAQEILAALFGLYKSPLEPEAVIVDLVMRICPQ